MDKPPVGCARRGQRTWTNMGSRVDERPSNVDRTAASVDGRPDAVSQHVAMRTTSTPLHLVVLGLTGPPRRRSMTGSPPRRTNPETPAPNGHRTGRDEDPEWTPGGRLAGQPRSYAAALSRRLETGHRTEHERGARQRQTHAARPRRAKTARGAQRSEFALTFAHQRPAMAPGSQYQDRRRTPHRPRRHPREDPAFDAGVEETDAWPRLER